jgi:NAD(P)-dependent dehydrogenase (short-subunit alcohol dehydrogenase family)
MLRHKGSSLAHLLLIIVKGSIINVSSGLAFRGGKGSTIYAASKAGIIGFTKSLAQELAPRIRVNAIAPGYVDTDMTKGILCEITNETFQIKCGRH